MGYPLSMKEAVIQKVLAGNKPQIAIAQEAGIGRSTLSYWLRNYKKNGASKLSLKEKSPREWTVSEKVEALITTGPMTEDQRNRWCRKKGIFTHNLNQWKKEVINAAGTNLSNEQNTEVKRLKKELSKLHKELARKDKALSETAALLILKKKADLIWGANEDA